MCLGNKGKKTKTWKGFLSYAPDLSIMSLVQLKPENSIYAACLNENTVARRQSLLSGSLDYSVDECSLLFTGAVQIAKMAADGVCVCDGCTRHQLALSFGENGFMHDDTDSLPILDNAAPPEWSMVWRLVCPG